MNAASTADQGKATLGAVAYWGDPKSGTDRVTLSAAQGGFMGVRARLSLDSSGLSRGPTQPSLAEGHSKQYLI